MIEAPEPLLRDMLAWVAVRPRRYDDALDCWRTSCPRLPVWEDAFDAGFVAPRIDREGTMLELTSAGRAFLARVRP